MVPPDAADPLKWLLASASSKFKLKAKRLFWAETGVEVVAENVRALPARPGHGEAAEDERRMAAIVAKSGLEHEELHLKKGQAVIWAANLLHGGRPIRDPERTRHSQATHYYFEDCAHYIALMSDFPTRLHAREVIDMRTRRIVTPMLHGRPLDLDALEDVWRYPRPLPDWVED